MIYTGQFKNIKDKLYQVDINVSDNINTTTELIFSSEPFIIELNSNDVIYEPLKLSNATCNIVTNNYYFNLYSATAQGVKMMLKDIDSNKIVWVGYVTPNLYTMDYENQYEEVQIEAIDGLATLENYKYETVDIINKKIKSFEDLLIHIIKKCNSYSKIYVNKNNYLTGFENQKLIDKLLVSEQNFFNNDNEAVSYKEVLNELLQFLNYTIVADGDEIYILNYDYIKNNYTDYHTYSTTNNWLTYTESTATLNHNFNVTASSFKKNGGTIELANVYNQVAIKTNIYKKDSLIPDFFDDEKLTNIVDANHLWRNAFSISDGGVVYVAKYLTNSDYEYFFYDNDTNWIDVTSTQINDISGNFLQTGIGAIVTKQANYKLSDGEPNSLSFSNYIQLFRHMTSFPTINQNVLKPVLKIKNILPDANYLFKQNSSNNYYILISGSFFLTSEEYGYYVKDAALKNDDTFTSSQLYITAKIKIGDKYYNGSTWTTTDSTFKIFFKKGTESHLYYKWFDVIDQIVYSDYVDGKGQKILLNETDQLSGAVEFYLYTPQNYIDKYRVDNIFLKDFDIKIVKQNVQKNDDTDTEYKNVISEDYVSEFSDLELKVCSDTEKGMNYSSVIEKTNNVISFNQSIINKSLATNQLQEHNIIQSYVNQYSTPAKKLNLTLVNEFKPYSLLTIDDNQFLNEKFIVDGMSIDIKNDSNLLNLVSKK